MFHKVTDCWLITCHCYWISGTSTVEKAEEILLTWRKSKHCFCKCQVQILIFDFLFKCSMINLLITTPFSHTFKNIICSHQVGIYSTSVDNEAPSAGNGKKKKKDLRPPGILEHQWQATQPVTDRRLAAPRQHFRSSCSSSMLGGNKTNVIPAPCEVQIQIRRPVQKGDKLATVFTHFPLPSLMTVHAEQSFASNSKSFFLAPKF